MNKIPILHTPVVVVAQPTETKSNLLGVCGFVSELHPNPHWCEIVEVTPAGVLGRRGTINICNIEYEYDPAKGAVIAAALNGWAAQVEIWRKQEQLQHLAETYRLSVEDLLKITATVLG